MLLILNNCCFHSAKVQQIAHVCKFLCKKSTFNILICAEFVTLQRFNTAQLNYELSIVNYELQ